MLKVTARAAVVAVAITLGCATYAGAPESTKYVVVNEEVGLPVFPYDITDRPYEVIGEVKASVRKATIFSKAPSQDKIYRELWERGQKLGADAIIKAQYGDAHVTALSWGASSATGVAIKFKPAPAVESPKPSAEPAVEAPSEPEQPQQSEPVPATESAAE